MIQLSPATALASAKRIAGRPYRLAQRRLIRTLLEPDFAHNTITHRPLIELGVDAPGRMHYEPSAHTFLRRGLRRRVITPDDVFVDLGCGLGRVLHQAARHRFKRIIGVDISDRLVIQARENLRRSAGGHRCQKVQVACADLATWRVPDDVTYAYIYNAVTDDVFHGMLDQILDSLERRPRRLLLIYANPVMGDRVLATHRFTLVRTSRGLRRDKPGHTVKVFEGR